jgi:hypothetical protein
MYLFPQSMTHLVAVYLFEGLMDIRMTVIGYNLTQEPLAVLRIRVTLISFTKILEAQY